MYLCCIHSHAIGGFILFFLRQFIPGTVFPFGETNVLIDNTHLLHPVVTLLAYLIPTLGTVKFGKLLNVFLFCLQGPMRSIESQIQEERFVILLFTNKLKGMISESIRGIVRSFRCRQMFIVQRQTTSTFRT